MASRDTKKPNIVFILSDDQGYWAMGCAGNKYIQTPNMDRLAESGMMFENSYCASPVCSPARASILTGKMPSQHGVQDWIRLGHYGENALDYLAGQITLPEILKKNGYECAISGKWHLGDVNSVEKRFPDHTYIHLKGADHYYNAPMVRNGELVYESRYVTDCITDDAIAYLDQTSRTDAPFYLSVHYTAPHAPWINEHPEELTELYRDCPFDDIPQGFIHEDAVYRYEKEDARRALVGYYAAVTGMDRGVAAPSCQSCWPMQSSWRKRCRRKAFRARRRSGGCWMRNRQCGSRCWSNILHSCAMCVRRSLTKIPL